MNDVIVLKKKNYFNSVKFEKYISNANLLREKRIAKRNRNRIIDKILILIVMFLIVVMIAVVGKLVIESFSIYNLNKEIYSLENNVQKVIDDKNKKINELIKNTKVESLKRKAYLDLNMITPTNNHIIYFDKS